MKLEDIIAVRDARMEDTKRLMELSRPLKEEIEAALATGKSVSGAKWRRLSRYLAELFDNLSDMAALEQLRRQVAESE